MMPASGGRHVGEPPKTACGEVRNRHVAHRNGNFDELWVRSETGLGAEAAGEAGLTGRPVAQPGKAPASAM